jgi:ribulose-phosphate 3-epimerase
VHLHRVLQQIRAAGARVGVVLNPHTPLEGLRYVLDDIDVVLLMTVNPGFGGQAFIPAVVPKIAELRREIVRRGLATEISVDGGIAADTAGTVCAAGASLLVAGAAVFGQPDYRAAIAGIRTAGERGWASGQSP